MWEGGHRTVGIARWSGTLQSPGRTSHALAQTIDFMPTFVALARCPRTACTTVWT